MDGLTAHNRLADRILAEVSGGRTVLVRGPVGIGKTTILVEIARRVGVAGRPCGVATNARALDDVTEALAAAYPEVAGGRGAGRRGLRSALRLAAEERPGILLLDHLMTAGTALRGYLRSLRGTGLGVVIAVDVENPADHERVRGLHLAYREVEVPPLAPSVARRLVDSTVPAAVCEEDRVKIVRVAAGRPGRIVAAAEGIRSGSFWRDGRVLAELLGAELLVAEARHYLHK